MSVRGRRFALRRTAPSQFNRPPRNARPGALRIGQRSSLASSPVSRSVATQVMHAAQSCLSATACCPPSTTSKQPRSCPCLRSTPRDFTGIQIQPTRLVVFSTNCCLNHRQGRRFGGFSPNGRWLTLRSTGRYTACLALARHFILGQTQPCRSAPVTSNVRRRKFNLPCSHDRYDPR